MENDSEFLLIIGIDKLWPHMPAPVTWIAAVFAMAYPIPVLIWMMKPIQRALSPDHSPS